MTVLVDCFREETERNWEENRENYGIGS